MGVMTKSEAMDYAESIRKLVEALKGEGFDDFQAIELVKATLSK